MNKSIVLIVDSFDFFPDFNIASFFSIYQDIGCGFATYSFHYGWSMFPSTLTFIMDYANGK